MSSAKPGYQRDFLTPALLRLSSPDDHPLLSCELPFPFASLVAADEQAVRRLAARSRFVYPSPGVAA